MLFISMIHQQLKTSYCMRDSAFPESLSLDAHELLMRVLLRCERTFAMQVCVRNLLTCDRLQPCQCSAILSTIAPAAGLQLW